MWSEPWRLRDSRLHRRLRCGIELGDISVLVIPSRLRLVRQFAHPEASLCSDVSGRGYLIYWVAVEMVALYKCEYV